MTTPLHDRIAHVLDSYGVHQDDGSYGVPQFDALVDDLYAVLAETTTTQPERHGHAGYPSDGDCTACRAAQPEADGFCTCYGTEEQRLMASCGRAEHRAAAQPVEPEPERDPVFRLTDDEADVLAEPEPDDREALARIIHETAGACDDTDCTDPNDWGYCDKRADAILAAGFRRTRPEATHTVTAEQAHVAREAAQGHRGGDPAAMLRALGVTVTDTPTGGAA